MAEELSIPAELEAALADAPDAARAFTQLPPAHQNEYAQWVGEAKKHETRARRAARAIEQIRAVARGI